MDLDQIIELLISYGVSLLGALVVLLLGWKVISWLTGVFAHKLAQKEVDPSLQPFLVSVTKVLLQIMLVISIASMLGIAMTSFIAVLGAATLAVGLALQGSLANFAGGTLILLLKPYKVGDYIETAGYAGTVKEIQIFYTLLDTPDNKRVILPNALVSNSSSVNYTINEIRRIDIFPEASYQDDMEEVKQTLLKIAHDHPLVFEDPPPQVFLGEFGDSSLIFYFRMWCKNENYWPIYFEINELIKKAFEEKGITIPFPQRELHWAQNT